MIRWILAFLLLAIIAGALGFTGVAGTSIAIAQTLFYIFVVLFVLSLVVHLVRGPGPRDN